jgi:hypothetical protein
VFLVVAYHPAGSRWGTATLKFYEGRDNLTETHIQENPDVTLDNNSKEDSFCSASGCEISAGADAPIGRYVAPGMGQDQIRELGC